MTTIKKKVLSIQKEMKLYEEIGSSYTFIVEKSKSIIYSESIKIPQNLISGCLSNVWIKLNRDSDMFYMKGYSDALIVRGIISILQYIYNNENTIDIAQSIKSDIMDALNLSSLITPQRTNGILSIIEKIKIFCNDYK